MLSRCKTLQDLYFEYSLVKQIAIIQTCNFYLFQFWVAHSIFSGRQVGLKVRFDVQGSSDFTKKPRKHGLHQLKLFILLVLVSIFVVFLNTYKLDRNIFCFLIDQLKTERECKGWGGDLNSNIAVIIPEILQD